MIPAKSIELEKVSLIEMHVLGLLFNTLAADEKYSLPNRDNLTIQIQIHLSHEQKTFSPFLALFSKSRLKFEHFEKKDDPHRFCISEITDSENVVK